MTFRPGPLRAAAALAAGFVVVRVVYRVLFDGAGGAGAVVLPLPPVRLPAPFAHVVLLGPVTIDGLTDAVLSALPIALTILAFGLLNALVDLPRLFVRGARRGPLSGIARALAIAWATLPSLADAARAVRFAQRLRGERGGMRMLSPLLQRTLERAAGVASALELRGFAGRGLGGDCRTPVEASGLALGFGAAGGRERSSEPLVSATAAHDPSSARRDETEPPGPPVIAPGGSSGAGIRVGSLTLAGGTLTLVSGPTGSGKSTLLRALAGLHTHADGGWLRGRLTVAGHDRATVPPRDLARVVGVVLQHPREAFATERVRDEIGLVLELRGVAPVVVNARVDDVAARIGATDLLDRPTRGLSAGEATLVAVAAAVIEQPILLLVDEPLADLDAGARARIARLLDALAHEAGMCVVVAEHRVGHLAAIADVRLRIEHGAVAAGPGAWPGAGAGSGAGAGPGPGAGARSVPGTGSGAGAGPGPGAGAGSVPMNAAGGTEAFEPAAETNIRYRPPLSRHRAEPGPVALCAEAITVRHRGTVAVDGASLELRSGELVALVGPNGAGKSSLLAALALPERRRSGRPSPDGGLHRSADLEQARSAGCRAGGGRDGWTRAAGQVALVPDASDDLFVLDTVAAECARADRRAVRAAERSQATGVRDPTGESSGGPPLDTAARFAGFLGLAADSPEFAARLARHPRDLSVGERRCLAIALQLARDPAVLMVDEPTRGLDPAARELVLAALDSRAAEGSAVLVASHEPELAARADRVLTMRAGALIDPSPSLTQDRGRAWSATRRDRAASSMDDPEYGPGWRPSPESEARAALELAQRAASAPPPYLSQDRIAAEDRTPRNSGAPRALSRRDPESGTRQGRHRDDRPARAHRLVRAVEPGGAGRLALLVANLVALAAFCWPLLASAVPAQAEAAVPVAALALAPLAALVALATLDGTVRSAHLLALLGTLAAIGAAVRIASTGVGGVEAVFILLILAGRAFGARFALLLGMATIALSSLLWGAIGPWTPFQMFACAWVGAGAGLLPRTRDPRLEIGMLCVYGVAASYVFGLLMNLWFWPFAVGTGTGISYDAGAPLGTNLASFLLYSLVTSTAGWDTLRAVTTVVGVVVIGRPVLTALRRTKPLTAPASSPDRTTRPLALASCPASQDDRGLPGL